MNILYFKGFLSYLIIQQNRIFKIYIWCYDDCTIFELKLKRNYHTIVLIQFKLCQTSQQQKLNNLLKYFVSTVGIDNIYYCVTSTKKCQLLTQFIDLVKQVNAECSAFNLKCISNGTNFGQVVKQQVRLENLLALGDSLKIFQHVDQADAMRHQKLKNLIMVVRDTRICLFQNNYEDQNYFKCNKQMQPQNGQHMDLNVFLWLIGPRLQNKLVLLQITNLKLSFGILLQNKGMFRYQKKDQNF
ncbi:unnamed protein product [Paramecium sonneborni]|uniref:Uncharacterized protein n=1 Tax=Paramecium sonneborni TaxID=65129 RepID=A0A8S1QRV8_9CILI|nr:unnamed protein product [Paramecium sonneborni]